MGVEDATDRLYRDKVILAPMVRAGTLPFRALALRYGADTVFTEEVIDRRVVNAVRTENPVLETIDYVEARGKKGNATPFQTCPALERGRVVYQVGTGDATNALRAAQHVERDVAAVDVNMGCPKRFSLQGAMGAALLKRPEIAADIVGTLRRNLSVPVSTKIRLLDTPSETVEFAKRMEKAGACALTVHMRRVEDKPASKARWEELRSVVDAVNIPVIANGDMYTRADMAEIKALSGCSSVMLARPALLNCSVFKPDGNVLPLKEVIQQYLRECFRYDSIYQSAKYTVMEMLTKRRHPDHLKESICLGLPAGSPGMREVTPAKTLQQLAKIWDVEADYDAELARRTKRAEQLGDGSAADPAERSCVHRFDDAYFLEPEAAKSGGKVCATGAPKSVAVPAGRGGGGEAASSEAAVDSGAKTMREEEGGDGGGVFAKPTATAEVIMPEAPVDCTDDGGRGGGKGCAPALGEEVSSEDAARAKEKGGACPKGERNGAGRGDGGAVVRPTDDAAAAPREEGHGAGGAESNVTGVAEGGHNQNACAEPGADQPVGTDGTLGGVAVKGSRPPAVWASSKRPRTEEARAAAL